MAAVLLTMLRTGPMNKWVTLQNPGDVVPDPEGNPVETWTSLTPAVVPAQIKPATVRDMERVTAGTALATASHLVTIRYHPDVTTQTQILYNDRILRVVSVQNPDEDNVELILACTEIVP